jgi:hypothetical protein
MATTLFEAPQYDPRRDRRKKVLVALAALVVVILGLLAFLYRNWPEERVAKNFFSALESHDYEKAYGLWMADPNWKQHPEKYAKYPFKEFYLDWGPGGEWGEIKQFEIVGSANPKNGSGVVVVVKVNGRAEDARLWVEKSDKSLTFSPY